MIGPSKYIPITSEGIRLDVYTLEDERLEPTNHPF